MNAKEIFDEYAKLLESKGPEYFGGTARIQTGQQIATKMFDAIFCSNYPSDWLTHNKALKEACKKFGIKKSSELRDLIKQFPNRYDLLEALKA